MASVNGEAAAQTAAPAGGVEEGLAVVAREVDEEVAVVEMEAGSGWKRGARKARAMATRGCGWEGRSR